MSDDIVIEALTPVSVSWQVGSEMQQGFVNHTLLKVIPSDIMFPDSMEYEVLFGKQQALT